MDWNSDGRPDLLVGEGYADGRIRVYVNTNTAGNPLFGDYTYVQAGGADFTCGGLATPEVADWNGDGRPDIVCGASDGAVRLLLNVGTAAHPAFDAPVLLQDGDHDLSGGWASCPAVVDWDGDGRKDLLVGNGGGEVLIFLNAGTDTAPVFDGAVPVQAGGRPVSVASCARPDAADWDGDGLCDLLVGGSDGAVWLFQSVNTNLPRLSMTGYVLNDDAGNGNGEIEPGETVLVTVSLTNAFAGAAGVTAVLSSRSPHLAVVVSNAALGAIGPGRTARNSRQPFCVRAGATAPAHALYPFRLDIAHEGAASPRSQEFTVGRYVCDGPGTASWIDMSGGTPLAVGDEGWQTVDLGFAFPFYDREWTQVHVFANGYLAFGDPVNSYNNTGIPDPSPPNGYVAPFWDDLNLAAGGALRCRGLGSAPKRSWAAEWSGVPHYSYGGSVSFQVILHENGEIRFQYGRWVGTWGDGSTATIGLESPDGADGVLYSCDRPGAVTNGLALTFRASGAVPDLDRDGLADPCEQFYFGDLSWSGSDDVDGDGVSNRDEIHCGTDPGDAASRFGVEEADLVEPGRLRIRWPSAPGREYGVEGCTNLLAGGWTNVPAAVFGDLASGTGGCTVNVETVGSPGFLRVRVH